MPNTASRSSRLEARIAPDTLAAVRRAAEIEGRSVSDFVVTAARQAAERTIAETLADRTRFGLDDARWQAFQAALDAPARAIPEIRELLDRPGIFDRPSAE